MTPMPKRTSPHDARNIEEASDLDEIVTDKRAGWRATPAKARRRQRRYKKRLIDELTRLAREDDLDESEE